MARAISDRREDSPTLTSLLSALARNILRRVEPYNLEFSGRSLTGKVLEEFGRISSTNTNLLLLEGELMVRFGNPDKGYQLVKKAVEQSPEDSHTLLAAAKIMEGAERAIARSYYEKALRLKTGDHLQSGRILECLGRREEAILAYESAIHEQNFEASTDLRRLRSGDTRVIGAPTTDQWEQLVVNCLHSPEDIAHINRYPFAGILVPDSRTLIGFLRRSRRAFLIEEEGKIIGFINHGEVIPGHRNAFGMVIGRSFSGKGSGYRALRDFISRRAEFGVGAICGYCNRNNEPIISAMRRCGFRRDPAFNDARDLDTVIFFLPETT